MSNDRTPSDRQPTSKPYHVDPTQCNCHPETCCCPDYTLWDGETKVARGSDKTALQKLADIGNISPHSETRALCEHYWGDHDRRCQRPHGHEGEHLFLVPGYAIDIDAWGDEKHAHGKVTSAKAADEPELSDWLHADPISRMKPTGVQSARCTCQGSPHESASSSGYTPDPKCPVHAANGRASNV